ncbi:MAG: RNA polymerase factor sigma-54, partial [Planctomycetes bacterium]|nr:RNA polymerase factor sigma-54 [Planctomycetota bacterium]
LRVARAIVEHQKGFFDIGVAGLKPLVMRDIAEEVGMVVSTISRTVANKFIETPQGTYPLKYFFVQQASADDDEDASSIQVKEHIKTLIEDENRKRPLSDDALVKSLKDRFGTTIARRTVAKYREALGIPNSRQRKEFT